MSKIIEFYLQGNEPYLTKIQGLTKVQLETFIKQGFPITNDGLILTTMTTFFSKEIKKIPNHDVVLNKHQVLSDIGKFKVNLIETPRDFIEFCIQSPLPETYMQLLKMKVKMNMHSDFKCLLFDKKYLPNVKQEKNYIAFTESQRGDEKRSRESERESPLERKVKQSKPSIQTLNNLSSYFGDRTDYIQFRGNYMWEWGWLLFLEKELGAKIVCVWKGTTGDGGMFFENKKGFEVKDWVLKELKRCFSQTKSRFTVGILSLTLDTGVSHANALIFDSENKIITRFEPHGAGLEINYNVGELDSQIGIWMGRNLNGWTYQAPIHYCPTSGPQTLETKIYYDSKMKALYGENLNKEAGGFCSAWSLLFLHYRLVNPELSDRDIVEYMVSESGEILFNRIREYVAFIVKNVDKNWTTVEKRLLLSVGDNVQFKKSKDNMEYGRIISITNDIATVFSINNLKDRSSSGEALEYKLYNVKLSQLSLIDDNLESIIKTIANKVAKHANVIKKTQTSKK